MITETQTAEIRNYLAARNLPMDVIMEVKDHFETQIEKFEQTENFSFDRAFYQTKLLWQRDFKMVRKSWISFRKIPRIARDIQMAEMKSLLKKALVATFIFSILSFSISHFITKQNFNHYLLISNCAVAFPVFALLIYYLFSQKKKHLILAEVYYYNQLLIVFFIPLIIAFVKSFIKIPDISMYLIYNNSFSPTNIFYIFYNIMEDIVTNTFGIYFLLFLLYRFKTIRNIRKVLSN